MTCLYAISLIKNIKINYIYIYYFVNKYFYQAVIKNLSLVLIISLLLDECIIQFIHMYKLIVYSNQIFFQYPI